MNIVSYAQNHEDVMLWRALKDFKNGFYIDVGANDSKADSVTKLFYDNGWSGINIEPLELHHKDLVEQRKRDINLKCAAGSASGELYIWECDVRGWATMDETVVAKHIANDVQGIWSKVAVKTLKEICNEHVSRDIQFLKIDVEGFEKNVLEGMDFTQYRPWILVIEATKPNTSVENYEQWENIVISANYIFAYSDGLNRFYLAKEQYKLLSFFKFPPNVFDAFIPLAQLQAEQRANQLLVRATQAEHKIKLSEAKVQKAEAKIIKLKALAENAAFKFEKTEAKLQASLQELQLVYASTSWRITAPLRILGPYFKKMKMHNSKLKLILQHVRLYIARRPRLKKTFSAILNRIPKLKLFLIQRVSEKPAVADNLPTELLQLTPRSRNIFYALKKQFKKNMGEG